MSRRRSTREQDAAARELDAELKDNDKSVGKTEFTTEEAEDRDKYIELHTGGKPPGTKVTSAAKKEMMDQAQNAAEEIQNRIAEGMLPGLKIPRRGK